MDNFQRSGPNVFGNSTERQHALVNRAIEIGWPLENILVIDEDRGQHWVALSLRPSDASVDVTDARKNSPPQG
jgi:hypothetical protein